MPRKVAYNMKWHPSSYFLICEIFPWHCPWLQPSSLTKCRTLRQWIFE